MMNIRLLCLLLLLGSGSMINGQDAAQDSAYWYFMQGKRYVELEMREEAEREYLKAYPIYVQKEAWDSCILSLLGSCKVSPSLWDKESVEIRYEQAYQLADSLIDPSHGVWGDIFSLKSALLSLAGQASESQKYQEKAHGITLQYYGPNHSASIGANLRLAHQYMRLRLPSKSMDIYQQILKILPEIEIDSFSLAIAYEQIGFGFFEIKRLTESLDYYRRSLAIYQKLLPADKPFLRIGSIYNSIGKSYLQGGNSDLAIENLFKSLKIYEQILPADDLIMVHLYVNLAQLYFELRSLERAVTYGKWALDILIQRFGKDSRRIIDYHYLLGSIYLFQKDFHLAIEQLDRSIYLAETQTDASYYYLPFFYSSLAQAYQESGKLDTAIFLHHKAIQIEEHSGREVYPFIGTIYFRLAQAYVDSEEYELAKQWHRTALQSYQSYFGPDHPNVARAMYRLGIIAYKEEQIEESLEFVQSSMAVLLPQKENPGFQISVSDIPFHVQTDVFHFLNLASQNYLLSFEKTSEVSNLYRSFDIQSILVGLDDSIGTGPKGPTSQLSVSNDFDYIYQNFADILYTLYQHTDSIRYLELGFKMAERNRANVLKRAFLKSRSKQILDLPDHIVKEEKMLQDSIIALQKQLQSDNYGSEEWISTRQNYFETSIAYQNFLRKLAYANPSYFQLLYSNESPSVDYLQHEFLNDNQAIIEFDIGEKRTYAYLITSDDFKVIPLPHPSSFSHHIQVFRKQISEPIDQISPHSSTPSSTIPELWKNANYLYQLIFAPIRENLNQLDELIIIPDDELGFLPFELLVNTLPDSSKIPTFLLHSFQISYAFSASLLTEMQDAPDEEAKINLLVMSPHFPPIVNNNPQFYTRDSYFPLPFSRKESQHISDSYQATLLIDSLASKAQFKALSPKSRIIHLATHAKAFNKDSRFSHIAFSLTNNVNENDNHLNVDEIYAMNLQAEMVVLSACETGLGEIKKGEGIISLGRAFTYAGAKSIISTLWSVNDQSTSELMISFYDYLDQGMRKDAALRHAKLDYLNSHDAQFSHPYFWAAPIAIGDMSAVELRTKRQLWIWILGIGVLFCMFAGLYMYTRKSSS
ncbi:MAG: CHAT domain-containing tetratricopeptide repeat protein [Bacteroidota bacterium]